MNGIFALDLGLDTGWALERIGRSPLHGEFSVRRFKTLGQRFDVWGVWFRRMLVVNEPSLCCFEAPIPRGNKLGLAVPRIMNGLSGICEMICFQEGVRCSEVAPSEVKKAFAGTGKADKDMMIAECRRRGWVPETNNAADGLGVMAYAVSLYHARDPLRMHWVSGR